MTEKNLTNTETSSALSRETTRNRDSYISPVVDIYETDEVLTLVADVPGLNEKSLSISVDQGILTIQGDASAGMGPSLHREFAMAGYWRQFLLSDAFDAENAEASISQGVMTLRIPKAEAAKPKRIEVSVH